LDGYGIFDGAALNELVHRGDSWKNVKKDDVISNEAMEKY
jgi:hypothetical protein